MSESPFFVRDPNFIKYLSGLEPDQREEAIDFIAQAEYDRLNNPNRILPSHLELGGEKIEWSDIRKLFDPPQE